MSFENAEIGQCPNLAPPPLFLPDEEEPEEEEEESKPLRPPLSPTLVTPPPGPPVVSEHTNTRTQTRPSLIFSPESFKVIKINEIWE